MKNCYTRLAEQLNAPRPTEAEVRNAIRMPPKAALRNLFGDQGNELAQIFDQMWRVSIKGASSFPGIPELLDEIASTNVTVGTVTSRNSADTMALLNSAGLSGSMQTIITWGHYRVAKPSPACILAALRETDTPSNRAAYVGDQPADMQAARQAGVLAVGAVWDQYADEERLRNAGAHIIVVKPIEILGLVIVGFKK